MANTTADKWREYRQQRGISSAPANIAAAKANAKTAQTGAQGKNTQGAASSNAAREQYKQNLIANKAANQKARETAAALTKTYDPKTGMYLKTLDDYANHLTRLNEMIQDPAYKSDRKRLKSERKYLNNKYKEILGKQHAAGIQTSSPQTSAGHKLLPGGVKPVSEEELIATQRAIKYGGMSYQELEEAKKRVRNRAEYEWISAYQDSDQVKKSSEDYAKRLDELNEMLKNPTSLQKSYGVTSAEEYEAAVKAAKNERNELRNKYYTLENEEKRASLASDSGSTAVYEGAVQSIEDAKKIRNVLAAIQVSSYDDEQLENIEYIKNKYGLDFRSMPSDQYVNALQGLLESKNQSVQEASALLEARGDYKFERMYRYGQMLEDQAEYTQRATDFAADIEKNVAWANVKSILATPAKGFEAALALTSTIGHNDPEDYENYVPMNNYRMTLTQYSQMVREATSEKIDSKVLAFMYQTGMSIAESAAMIATLGPLASVAFGGSAAADYIYERAGTGATNGQIIAGALASGIAEALFEHVSIEHLLKPKNAKTLKAILKETLEQAGVEASEEVFTEISNIISDTLIMGDYSERASAIKNYKAEGLTDEQAKQRVFLDNLKQVGMAGLGGFISGAVMGGTHTAISSAVNARTENKANQQIGKAYAPATDELIQEGLQSGKDTDSYKQAARLQERQQHGKKISDADVGRLVRANQQAIEAESQAAADTTINNYAKEQKYSDKATETLKRAYTTYAENTENAVDAETYAGEWNIAYNYGRENIPQSYIDANRGYTRYLSDTALQNAYDAGRRESMIEEGQAIESKTKTQYNDNQNMEVASNAGEEVYLRGGSERIDGTDTGGEIRELETRTGQDQSRGISAIRPADSGAARLTYARESVTTASLGVDGGSTADRLYVVTGDDTEATRQAKTLAKKRGLDLVLVGGGNLTVNGTEVRAYIAGNKVIVRADHPQFTSYQLMRHEAGHDMIVKGEVNLKTVRERIEQKIGKAYVNDAASLYAMAYMEEDGTSALTADEIWEEVVCDSLGDMNIFAPVENLQGPIQDFLTELKGVTEESRQGSRGPPAESAGKASREYWRPNLNKSEWSLLNRTMDAEIETSDQYLDEDTKWLYKTEKGTTVFAIYGIGDGTVPTPLYAVGGAKATQDYRKLQIRLEGAQNGNNSDRTTLSRLLRDIESKRAGENTGISRDGQRRSDAGSVQISEGQRRSDRRSDTGRGAEDSGRVTGKASREVDTAMSMAQARDMVQRAFVLSGIKEWYDGEYRNGDEWLKAQGSDEVEMYIENEYTLQEKYLNKIPAYLDGDITVSEILDAYLEGTLQGTVAKPKAQRLDTTQRTEYSDSRFYAPQSYEGENVTALYETANQRATSANRNEVNVARAKLLFIAHDGNVAETLGISQSEFNKKLRAWSRYSKQALEVSRRINAGVPTSNRWTGIQNCSIINKMAVSDEDILQMVKDISGKSTEYKRQYIGRTMLALDTHIDWSNLSFEFKSGGFENKSSTRGMYSQNKISIANSGYANTVAHEMGHALDAIWGREVFSEVTSHSGDTFLTDTAYRPDLITDAETRQFYYNFRAFVDSITDSSDIRSGYTADVKEVFARFVAKFVEFTDMTAGNSFYQESSFYSDRFNSSQYLEFARLLQEKAMLDAKRARSTENQNNAEEAKFSRELIVGESGMTYGMGVYLDSTLLDGLTENERVQMVAERVKELGGNSFVAYDPTGAPVEVSIAASGRRFRNKSGQSVPVNRDLTTKNRRSHIKQETVVLADELINTATYQGSNPAHHAHDWLDNNGTNRWDKWTVYVQDKNKSVWEATLHIANTTDGEKILYDINQIKMVEQGGNSPTSTTDTNNTTNPGNVNSDSTATHASREIQTYSDLAEQNSALREKLAEMTELAERKTQQADYWRGQTRTTKEKTLRQDDVNRMTREVLRHYDSTLKVGDVNEDIKDLGEFILRGGNQQDELTWSAVKDRARDIAETIIDSAEGVEDGYDAEIYRDLRRYFRNNKIAYVGSSDIADFNNFRKRNMGYITFAKDGTPIDELWGELTATFGEGLFPSDIMNPTDQILQAVDVLHTMKPERANPFKPFYSEAIEYCANEIIDRLIDENVRQTAPTYADRMQAKIENERAKGAQRLSNLRQQKNQRIAEIEERGRERLRNYREARSKTALRRDIRKVADDLNGRLRNPTENRHIPPKLVRAVVDLMEAVDLTTTINKDGTVRDLGRTAGEKLAKLNTLYESLKEDRDYSAAYDPVVKDMITNLMSAIGDTPVNNMSRAQLEMTLDVFKAIRKTAADSVKLLNSEFKKNIYETGRELISETNAAPTPKNEALSDFLNWQLSPDRFFERLAGFKKDSSWSKVGRMFSDGTATKLGVERDFYYTFREFTEAKEFKTLGDIKNLVDIGLRDENGNPVKVTRGMMLSVYMHLLSEDNRYGFMYGGFSVPDIKKYYRGQIGDAYSRGGISTRGVAADLVGLRNDIYHLEAQLATADEATRAQISAEIADLDAQLQDRIDEGMTQLDAMQKRIEGMMTQYEKDLVKRAGEWYDGKSRDYINNKTMEIYGIKKAAVDHYYTIHRDTSFLNTDFDSISKNLNLENWGSLKDRVPSQKPILLTDIGFELNNHSRQLSSYVGYATAQRNFNKLFSVTMPGSTGQIQSVQNAVERKFGAGDRKFGVTASKYIENLIGNIVGMRQRNDILSGLYSNVARGSLTMNLRVGFSQLASIPTAAGEIGWGSMAKGFARGLRISMSTRAKQQLAQDNVYFWQRYRGEGGMREFADMKESRNRLDRAWNKIADTKVGKKLFNWCQDFDVFATASMWAMAEDYVAKNTDLKRGTAEFKQAVSDKYTDIIRKTQPNYTTTERSDLLRDTRGGIKLLTMFKTQSNQNFNMLYEANARLKKYAQDYKYGRNGVTKSDVQQARKAFANTATALFIGAGLSFVGLRALANALMYAVNGWRDDDDEVTAESTLNALLEEYISAQANMFTFGSEIYDVIHSIVSGERYYGLEDSALSLIGGTMESFVDLMQKITDADNTVSAKDYKKFASKLSAMLGIPWANVERTVGGIGKWIEDAENGELFSYEAGAERSNTVQYGRIWKAIQNDDSEKYEKVYAEQKKQLMDDGKSEEDAEKAIASGVKEQIKKSLLDGEIDEDEAISYLVRTDTAKDEDDAYFIVDEWIYKDENKDDEEAANYSKYGDVYNALLSGKDIDAAIKDMTDHGYDLKSVQKQIRDKLKEYYQGTEADGQKLTKEKTLSYLQKYGGLSKQDAESRVNDWTCKLATGISYDGIKEALASGQITRTKAIDMEVKYGGKTKEEATKRVDKWVFQNEYGVDYDDADDAYRDGKLTKAQYVKALMTAGGKTKEDAELAAELIDWQKAGYNSNGTDAIKKYHQFCDGYNIDVKTYAGVMNTYNSVGSSERYSKVPPTMKYINNLNLSSQQKTQIARSLWGESTVKKYKLW
ncbi:MAG: hypothetical protein IKZ82_06155 [Clostridia bacterium]|nr:hypothetical protein [Clostridia bacterium]